jgi:processive 1,2-diacylglycerol beta-glucosyltransferase
MRVLILHASAGSGHRRAAEAVAKALATAEPAAQVTVSDILDFTAPVFRNTYAKGYLRIVRSVPELWGYMYQHSDRKASIPWRRKVRSAFNAVNTMSLRGFLGDTQPDIMICTHFLALEILASKTMRRKFHAPLFCTVTDFAVHALWVVQNVDGYYVATEEARRHLIRRGQPAESVRVTGIPVDPIFAAAEPAATVRRRLGLHAELPTALVMSGGFGVGPALDLLKSLEGCAPDFQLLVVAGANDQLRRDCERIAATLPVPVRVFGFVNNVHEFMDAADVVVSKPGGLTVSEVMAKGKPMAIVDPIPGQEQRNCEHLLEAGAATRLYDMEDAAFNLRALLTDADRIAAMRRNAARLGRPRAALDVAEDALERWAAIQRNNASMPIACLRANLGKKR